MLESDSVEPTIPRSLTQLCQSVGFPKQVGVHSTVSAACYDPNIIAIEETIHKARQHVQCTLSLGFVSHQVLQNRIGKQFRKTF